MDEADRIIAIGGFATHLAAHGCTALLSVVTTDARIISKAIQNTPI